MSGLSVAWLLCLPLLIVIGVSKYRERSSRRGLPLPPGPKYLSLAVQKFFNPSQENPWITYQNWSKQYDSDIISINEFGRTTIILNSAQAIADLLEKRSALYSDRVRFPMLNELIGWNWNFCFQSYSQRWRERRRVFNQHFNSSAVRWLRPVHAQHCKMLLRQLLHSPNEFKTHLRRNQTVNIMKSVYGAEIKDDNDPFYEIAEVSMLSLSTAGIFGTFYVDFIPFLKHLPRWFPGAGFLKLAKFWERYVHALRDDCFITLRKKMELNEASRCIGKNMLESASMEDTNTVEVIQDVLGIAFGAGADTASRSYDSLVFAESLGQSISANLIFLLAMMLYPETQRKAQDEIDLVVGRDRLPDFSDQPNLPYVNALCKEVLRWQNVAPLSVAHAVTEDDVYKGFFIPKGCVIVENTWAVLHDPDVYAEPEKFIPDRFLKDGQIDTNVRDPQAYAFGSGRRICPGRYFALDSLYTVVTGVLACFTIAPPKDGGKSASTKMLRGVISFPQTYDAVIKPRYEGAEALIEDAVADLHIID